MPDNIGAIEVLCNKLRCAGVPSLVMLKVLLDEQDNYVEFINLVREYLPEREHEILAETTPARQVGAFYSHFQDRYFELHDGILEMMLDGEASYRDFTQYIPVIPQGMDSYTYVDIPSNCRLGTQLTTYLVKTPDYIDTIKTALADACRQSISVETLMRVPEDGYAYGMLAKITEGTGYEMVGKWARYLNSDMDNFFLDTDEETCYSGYGEIAWERGMVEHLTEAWAVAVAFHAHMHEFWVWLEEDPEIRFKEIIDFIEEKKGGD